jgi:cytochrome P450
MVPDRFRAYRRHEPVHWHAPSRALLVTRYDDVGGLLLDSRLTSQTLEHRLDELAGLTREQRAELSEFFSGWLSLTDGARHRQLRSLVTPLLTPSRLMPWGAFFDDEARNWAERMDRSRGEDTFARPYAAAVVGSVLGLAPDETRPALRAVGRLMRVLDTADAGAREATDALRTLTTLAERVRVRPPAEGQPTPLLHRSGLPAGLHAAIFVQLVAGGYDPLARCLTTCLSAADPAVAQLGDTLLDEVFRLYGPFELLPRVATESLDVGGCPVAAGTRVLLAIGSANRDEARFPDAGELRPGRFARHVAFGHGRHRCPASGLARLAVGAALSALAAESERSGAARWNVESPGKEGM